LKLEHGEQIKNLCKWATFAVKYGIDEKLLRILIEINCDKVSKDLSMLRYKECVVDRLGSLGETIFSDIIGSMKLKF